MDEKDFELAAELEQWRRDIVLQAHRAVLNEPAPADFDGSTCTDCGGIIHPLRLGLGKFRCLECQQVREFRGR